MCVRGGGGVGIGGCGQVGGGGECKITNMSHHRIHVHNIYFCNDLHFQGIQNNI